MDRLISMTWIGLSGVVHNQSPNVCLNGSKGCVVLSSFYEDLVQLDSIHIIGVMEMVVQIIERRLQLIYGLRFGCIVSTT
jgi:hypothetical protein